MFGKTGYREGGNRGGHDRFKWDEVKDDKYRENYLGHSQMAPVGRWQKGKDLLWYTKQGQGMTEEDKRRQELEAIKKRDQDMINQALGLAPKEQSVLDTQLEAGEIKQLLARGELERDRLDIERVEGLGAAPVKIHEHIGRKSLVERELDRMREAMATGQSFEYTDRPLDDVDEEDEGAGGKKRRKRDEDEEEKKRKKKEKKRKKEEKKERKKEKKREKEKEKGRERARERSSSEGSEPRRRRRSRSRS